MTTNTLVAKIWSFCDTLRDNGLGYGDYLEQLTYLLFLKMADENKEQYNLPVGYDWQSVRDDKRIGGNLLGNISHFVRLLKQWSNVFNPRSVRP